ncbi:MAG: hypothetical protein WCW40_05805 [Bacteroidota bacterium]
MKSHNDHSHKSSSVPAVNPILKNQSDWWKHNHPNEKTHFNTAGYTTVKTGAWKTYSAKNPGNKK